MTRLATITIMTLVLLAIAGSAMAQRVVTTTRDGEMPYPTWSAQHAAGRYDARADLVGGRFRARAHDTGEAGAEEVRVGTDEGIRLTNPVDAPPLTLPAGSIRAWVSGRYARDVSSEGAVASSHVTSTFEIDGAIRARTTLRHSVEASQAGGIAETLTIDDGQARGTVYARVAATDDALGYEVHMPEITLAPGASITVSYQLETSTRANEHATSTTDFYTEGARISVVLPPGARIETDLPGRVAWIEQTPDPTAEGPPYATASLLAATITALAFAFGHRRPGSI